MNPEGAPWPEAEGTIVGANSLHRVLVRLANGDVVGCRSFKRLHRMFGFLYLPLGRRVRIRFHPTKPERAPLIIEVLRDASAIDAGRAGVT